MNILSLFDGMSCGQIAINKLDIKYNNYYASEIDKYAIEIAKKNFPDTIHLGNVLDVKAGDLPKIDLLLGGSPCQGFSFAGKQLNFDDPRSKLFFEFVRLLKNLKPEYFLLENVKMKAEYRDLISKYLGVEPIEIDSTLVSAQNRKRLYWTNIPDVIQPEDKKILLKDILLTDGDPICYSSSGRGNGRVERRISSSDKAHTLTKAGYSNRSFSGVIEPHKIYNVAQYKKEFKEAYLQYDKNGKGQNSQSDRAFYPDGKMGTLPHSRTDDKTKILLDDKFNVRRITPIEAERLQTVPDDYTAGVSKTQRFKMLGNGWTVDVIAHILRGIK